MLHWVQGFCKNVLDEPDQNIREKMKKLHYSPFMTRHKPNSDNRRVILDLSWPRVKSFNSGFEKKNDYMGLTSN